MSTFAVDLLDVILAETPGYVRKSSGTCMAVAYLAGNIICMPFHQLLVQVQRPRPPAHFKPCLQSSDSARHSPPLFFLLSLFLSLFFSSLFLLPSASCCRHLSVRFVRTVRCAPPNRPISSTAGVELTCTRPGPHPGHVPIHSSFGCSAPPPATLHRRLIGHGDTAFLRPWTWSAWSWSGPCPRPEPWTCRRRGAGRARVLAHFKCLQKRGRLPKGCAPLSLRRVRVRR